MFLIDRKKNIQETYYNRDYLHYRWKVDKDLSLSSKILERINSHSRLDFDISIIKELKAIEFKEFREKFWKLIYVLRKKKVVIDWDSIRLQSIIYNTLLLGPNTLLLDISNKCNYRCSFCLAHSQFTKSTKNIHLGSFMSFKDIKRIVEQAYMFGTENIYLCGEGETLLHPQILDIISFIGKHDFRIEIMTNASISKIVSQILQLPTSFKLSFLLNLSAKNSKKFELIYRSPPLVYENVLENIKKMVRRCPVVLSYIVFKNTYRDIFQFIKLAHSLGVEMIRFKFPILYDYDHKKILLSEEELDTFLHSINKIKSFARKYKVKVDFKDILNYYIHKIRKTRVNRCYNGWFFLKIDIDGNVYICCRENKPLGKVGSGNIRKVLLSPNYIARIIEGKNCVNFNSPNWRKCKYCLEYNRNNYIDELIK